MNDIKLLNLPKKLLSLAEEKQKQWKETLSKINDTKIRQDKLLLQQFIQVSLASDYFFEQCKKTPQLFLELWKTKKLASSYQNSEIINEQLAQELHSISSEEELSQVLRMFRKKQMLRIIWRDILQLAPLKETTRDLSNLADTCINQATAKLYLWNCEKSGTPCDTSGNPQCFQVIALGKLGGRELNLSSDVDLLFTFPEDGKTQNTETPITNQQFFIHLGHALIKSLHNITADGFVFRVDMRLRPYGESGALAMSYQALKEYYREQGREWERYALIKARILAGEKTANKTLLAMLHAFVYRRYLDFSAMQSLREMKAMVRKKVSEKILYDDIKLGPGGIREIEFIAQAFQLIRGGQDKRLRKPQLLKTLKALQKTSYLNTQNILQLKEAYIFLRNLEHCLQALKDKQTHLLPKDEIIQLRTAYAMGFQDWESLSAKLNEYRQLVAEQFEKVISKPGKNHANDKIKVNIEDEEGRNSSINLQKVLTEWLERFKQHQLSDIAKQRLNRFLPHLLYAVTASKYPAETLDKTLKVIYAIVRRSTYLVLLEENPKALVQLVKLCEASSWIANQITSFPLLLGELLDERYLYFPSAYEQLAANLKEQLEMIDDDNVEQTLDILRQFKRKNELRVAAADISGILPIMKVSDYLTDIAIAILQQVLKISWQEMTSQYGYPQLQNEGLCNLNFVIIAYGKLAGIELGYGSDLDLVFLHDADEKSLTNGEKKVTGAQFFSRFTQRILHMLSIQTNTGRLYDIDTRLKPSGQSGMIVSHFDAFSEYQHKNAWLWEHQALVRSRVVAGDCELGKKFATLRCEVLGKKRNDKQLREEITAMRERMIKEAKSTPEDQFDLKQGRGGITDIEFIVQYIVLAWSHLQKELLIFTDNIRILETCESGGLLPQRTVDELCNAYRDYRHQQHHLSLQYQPPLVSCDMFPTHRENVQKIWQELLG